MTGIMIATESKPKSAMTRIVFINAQEMVEMMNACPEWEIVSFHYEDAHPLTGVRVIIAARPHEAKHLRDLATLLGAHKIEDPRDLLVTGQICRADELAFVISNYMGGLGLMVHHKAKPGNG
jgi:hypothetical protein